MNFAITTLAVAALVLMTTAVITWPRRHTAYWIIPFLGLSTAVSIWLIGYALELSVMGLETKLFWAKTEYIGIAFTPVAWFLFAYQFLNQNTRNLKSFTILLSVLPTITIIIAFTNHQHSLLWTQNVLDESGPIPLLANSYGGWFWIHSVYSYLLILGGIAFFFRTIKLYPDPFRWQSVVLILAAGTPLLGNALYLADLSPIPQFDLTPFSFAVSALLISWGVARLDLFDIIPIARRMVVESLPDSIVLLDISGRILDINQAGKQLLGSNGRQLVGQLLTQLPGEIVQKVAAYTEPEIEDEITVEHKGQTRHFNIQIRPFYISGPHPRARILILRDIGRRMAAEAGIRQRNLELQQLITEAQIARETAENANKAKSDLLAKVSHELRTPLSAILGHAEMLQEGVHGEITEKQNHSLNRIIENSEHLNEQVKDLLDLSRFGSQKVEIELYEFDLKDALDQVASRLQPAADEKNLTLKLTIAPDVPQRITGNAVRLQQILVNLGMNAIKFTENGGQIGLAIELADAANWCIKVTDNGRGIPQTELKNIFQPFHQLGSSMTRANRGVGLGLAIVKELITALNGKIEVVSQVGLGSTFTVTLPLFSEGNNV